MAAVVAGGGGGVPPARPPLTAWDPSHHPPPAQTHAPPPPTRKPTPGARSRGSRARPDGARALAARARRTRGEGPVRHDSSARIPDLGDGDGPALVGVRGQRIQCDPELRAQQSEIPRAAESRFAEPDAR